MDPAVELALRSLLTLFVVMDPVGLVPVFVSLAGDRPAAAQHLIARRAVVVAGAVLISFALGGGPLLAYLGITLDALRVAGGVLLFRIGVDMVYAQVRRETPEEEAEAREKEDISIFPLAIPMISGPGALASVLLLTTEAHGDPGLTGIVLGAGVVVLVAAWVVLRIAARLARLVGQTAINVLTRVLGLILTALAVQYAADGLIGLGLFRV